MSFSKGTCPDTKCSYDKQLQPKQPCPLCGKEVKEFKFNEFGELLKKKWAYQKLVKQNEKYENFLKRVKFCPKCGSTNIFWAHGLPQLWSIWECRECFYRGPIVLEDGALAAILRKEWKEKLLPSQ